MFYSASAHTRTFPPSSISTWITLARQHTGQSSTYSWLAPAVGSMGITISSHRHRRCRWLHRPSCRFYWENNSFRMGNNLTAIDTTMLLFTRPDNPTIQKFIEFPVFPGVKLSTKNPRSGQVVHHISTKIGDGEHVVSGSATESVPEPTTLLLALLILASMPLRT